MTTTGIVRHTVPAPEVVVIDEEHRLAVEDACARADAIERVDATNLALADEIVAEQARMGRQIVEDYRAVKDPIVALGRAVDRAKRDVYDQLNRSKIRLAGLVADHHEALERERRRVEAENRRRIEQAKREAAEEQAALAREVEALAAQGVETDEDRRALRELTVEQDASAQRHAIVPLASPPEAPRSNVVRRKIPKVEIVDPSRIPHQINGLELMRPVEANIKKLLSAGVEVPGARLVETRSLATRG